MTRLPGARGVAALAAAALAGRRLRPVLAAHVPGGAARFERRNHRGDVVTLLEGPVATLAAAAGVLPAPGPWRRAGLLAVLGAGAFGALDDLGEAEGDRAAGARGLRGHLAAARRGRLTTGAWKVLGIGATGVAAAWTVRTPGDARRAQVVDLAAAAALVAGSANLLNLLDLRPGRALKAALVVAAALSAGPAPAVVRPLTGAVAGSALAALDDDLASRSMLGDTGANALGALLGVAVLARCGRRGRLLALGAVLALTGLSERVSFTKVIEATPVLRALDRLGRP
ncbi:hypothetical protein [Kineococcus rubinsiae]|uniref:hypothetical protein n=1 Tax=Kineococcus rubinsiae TaxID=2609562 RepID=UPI001431B3C3|nr:hypothetical protein [Kineococcus rubinsiae]NIZ93677.1 hypothetical protein [Kineococcus rubinsiae]